jgi:hypothetical protein
MLKQHPSGGGPVALSAPANATPNVAIVYYRVYVAEIGFACLQRSGNQWSLRSRWGMIE